MNFAGMPELHWPFGYPLVILISIAVVVISFWFFKKKKYLSSLGNFMNKG